MEALKIYIIDIVLLLIFIVCVVYYYRKGFVRSLLEFCSFFVSVILTTGVSGIFFLSQSFAGVSLAMVFGVILNLILKEGKKA